MSDETLVASIIERPPSPPAPMPTALDAAIAVLPETEPHVFYCETIQITPFRKLFTALKEIIHETNVVITPEGILIVAMDKSHTILAHVCLDGDKFEAFTCNKERIVLWMNVTNFFKIISAASNVDTLELYIESKYYNNGIVLYLTIKIASKNQSNVNHFRLIEPDAEEIEYPTVNFPSVIRIPSADFQKIVRDMQVLSDKMEIKSVGNELHFNCHGAFTNAAIIRSEEEGDNMKIISESSVVTQGVFSLKSLNQFIRCTNLCPQLELHLKNDMPLVVKYSITLGFIQLALSPLPPTA